MSDIFISYSRKDRQFVSRLANDLESKGWVVYYDLRLKPSQNFEEVLAKEAQAAKYFLLVLSPASLKSAFVSREAKAALGRERNQATTVVPLLIEPCKPQEILELMGPKYYADFTNDYDAGFKELLSTLGESGKDIESTKVNGSKRMGLKEGGIGAAIIAAIVALVTAYWQFVYKPGHIPDPPVQYAGRVTDQNTRQAIVSAKISVETEGAPQIYYSDTEGIFYLKLPASVSSARIRVDAAGYQTLYRNVAVPRTGVEDVPLSPSATPTPQNSPSPSASRSTNKNKNNRLDEIRVSENSNRRS